MRNLQTEKEVKRLLSKNIEILSIVKNGKAQIAKEDYIMTEVKEIIDKVYETIDSLYEDGKLRPYMRVYVDKDIIPEMFKSITGTYTDNNPDTYIFKYRSTYNTDIEFVGIDSNLMNGNLIYFVDGE